MTHGWPGSIVDFMKLIEPLTNPTEYSGPSGRCLCFELEDPGTVFDLIQVV
jgi:hypothetical protein